MHPPGRALYAAAQTIVQGPTTACLADAEVPRPARDAVACRHLSAAPYAARRTAQAGRAVLGPVAPGSRLVPPTRAPGRGRDPHVRRPEARGQSGPQRTAPTTSGERVRVIVADDGSAPEHVERAARAARTSTRPRREARGFAANCNRGLRATRADEDVVLLNSDVIAAPGWLEVLQHAAYVAGGADVGIVGAKLLYPDGTIQFAGTIRNPDAPEWFDHRFRFRPADYPPASVMQPSLAITGACMYVTADTLDGSACSTRRYGMAFEDVDYCLRAWEAGRRVVYAPAATLTHLESKTRGHRRAGRARARRAAPLLGRWGDWFDRARRRAPDGGLRIVYVTQDIGRRRRAPRRLRAPQRAAERGHHPELWTLDTRETAGLVRPRVPVRSLRGLRALVTRWRRSTAIKVATWWETAPGGLGGRPASRHAGLLRPGHRDVVLPDGPRRPRRGPDHLPA